MPIKIRERFPKQKLLFQRDHTTNNQRMENKITITLIAVVMLFLICQIPNSLILIYHSMNTAEHSVLENFIFRVLGNMSNLLIVINAAANFILYTALSAKYRRTLLTTVLRPCFPVVRRTNSASNTLDSSLSGRGKVKLKSNTLLAPNQCPSPAKRGVNEKKRKDL